MSNEPKPKKITVTGAVTEHVRDLIEDYRWQERKSVSDVVNEALKVWAESKGLPFEPSTEAAPADEKKTANPKA